MVNIWQGYGKKLVGTFLWLTIYSGNEVTEIYIIVVIIHTG